MKGFVIFTLVLLLGVTSFAEGKDSPASIQLDRPDGHRMGKPTLATYVQFDEQNPKENCAGQGGGEGMKMGDKCMYRPHLYDQKTNEIIGYATFLVTFVVGYEDHDNVEEFVTFTLYFSPKGQGDNAGNNTVYEDNLITLHGRFKSTGRATRCAVTGGTGTYLAATGYSIATPGGYVSKTVSRFYHDIYLCKSGCNMPKDFSIEEDSPFI